MSLKVTNDGYLQQRKAELLGEEVNQQWKKSS